MTGAGFLNKRLEQAKKYDDPAKQMTVREAKKIPAVKNTKYKEELVKMDLSMLSVDIEGYTKLVTNHPDEKVLARVMKLYVNEMTAAIREHGGTIISIEGDGILGAFSSSSEEGYNAQESAVRCAVTMGMLLKEVVNQKIEGFNQLPLKCRYGVDYGRVYIVRAGVKGGRKNDLIFIGKVTSTAVKIQAEADRTGYVYVSPNVHSALSSSYKEDPGWTWYRTTLKSPVGLVYYNSIEGGWGLD